MSRSKEYIVSFVRMQSAAGYYLGSISFEDGNGEPNDRDSGYYPSEEMLQSDYPNSISMKEAFDKARAWGKLSK